MQITYSSSLCLRVWSPAQAASGEVHMRPSSALQAPLRPEGMAGTLNRYDSSTHRKPDPAHTPHRLDILALMSSPMEGEAGTYVVPPPPLSWRALRWDRRSSRHSSVVDSLRACPESCSWRLWLPDGTRSHEEGRTCSSLPTRSEDRARRRPSSISHTYCTQLYRTRH